MINFDPPQSRLELLEEQLWRKEIITDFCLSCKTKKDCYNPYKLKSSINTVIKKIKTCSKRISSLEF